MPKQHGYESASRSPTLFATGMHPHMEMTKIPAKLACFALTACCSLVAHSKDLQTCRTVNFADIGWTDIAATTGLASTVFDGLGYQAKSTVASIPIALAGLKSRQIDVFLGYWKPSMDSSVAPFVKTGSVKVLSDPNLMGAKYTLAVPTYEYDAGLKSFADIAKFGNQLQNKIYGIEPGNDGNLLVQKMINEDQFNLKGFKLVESSEAGMLVEVNRAVRDRKWIVFLGWAPHPMNVQLKMSYLVGGDNVFGPNYGEAKVYTMVPDDYIARCPNAGRLATNLKFTVDMENQIMQMIMVDKKEPNVAAKEWLQHNPGVLAQWLTGVQTFDGKQGLPAVKAYLGIQ
jgi:glycine betaine/proline transport system substrate-binding protein